MNDTTSPFEGSRITEWKGERDHFETVLQEEIAKDPQGKRDSVIHRAITRYREELAGRMKKPADSEDVKAASFYIMSQIDMRPYFKEAQTPQVERTNPFYWDLLIILREIREESPDLSKEIRIPMAYSKLTDEIVKKTGFAKDSPQVKALLAEALEKAQDLNPKAFKD